MKIIKAKDYGWRKIVVVVENDAAPRWVHYTKDAEGLVTGWIPSPDGHTGNTDELGTVCGDCRYNWKEREFIFTQKRGQDLPTDADIIEEILEKLRPGASPKDLSILGRDI